MKLSRVLLKGRFSFGSSVLLAYNSYVVFKNKLHISIQVDVMKVIYRYLPIIYCVKKMMTVTIAIHDEFY